MESTNFNFDADMDFSGFNMTSQQAYSKPDEGNTSAFFFGDEGIDTVGSFGQQYDSMNPALFSTNPQESSFGLQQQLSMDNTMANASAWTGQLTPEAQTSLNSFPPTPVQSFDSLCQPNYNTILGKRSLQLDVPEFPQPKRHETFSPFTPSTSSWQLDSQSTPSMASVEIGLSDEAADVCATWFNKYAMLPSDRHIESLSQLTGESSKAIRHWFGRLLKQGMGSHDSAYKSQTGFSQSEQLWADVTQQTSPDLSFNDFTATTLSENSCNHETTNNQPSPPLRGGKKGCTPTDDPELLRRDANKIYQCTRKCGKRYGRKCDWKRNEEEGYPSKSWMCSLCKTQGVEKVKPCFRKYHFSQHFRNIHPGVNCEEFEESSIVYSETDFPRKCGFCRHRFVSRQDRIDHIADHFKQGKCMLDWNDDDDDNNHDSDNADDDDSPSGGDGGDGSEPYDPPTGDDSQDGHNPKHMGGGSSGGSSGFDGQPPQNGFFQFQLSQLKSNAPGGQCSDEKQRIEPGAGRNADPGTEQQVETCAKQIIRAGADWHILQSPTRPGADPQSEIFPAEDAGEQGSIHGQSPSSQQLQSSQEISDQRSMHGRHDPTKANDQDLVARNAVSGALLARSESPEETVQSHSEVESLRTMTESLKQDITRTLWLKGWLDAAHSKLDASMPESSKLTASLASMKQNRHGKDSVEGIPKLQTTNDLGLELLGGMNTEGPIAVVDPSLNQEVSGLVDKLSQTIAAQISSSALLSQGDPIQTRPRPRSENDTDMKNASGATSANTSQGNEKNSRASPDKQPDGLDQSSFLSLRLLGAGGFGTVDEVIHRQTNLRMARKTLKNREPSALQELKKEVDMLQKLRHPHVIRLLGSYTKDNKMSLLITPVADTTLALWLDKFVFQKPANLSEVIVKMFGCLVSSVRYLHEQRPVVKHMDIKPQNILVMHGDQEFPHVVLCDFGVSSSEEILYDTSPRPLTRHYIAPEVLEGQKRELSSDIWSLGCVLFEMASVPFSQDNPNWQRLRKEYSVHTGKYYWQDVTGLQHKLSGILSQAKSQSESTVVQTVQSMLHASPAERPSATALTLLFTPAPCCLNWPNDNVAFPGPKEEARTVEMLLNNNGVNPREQFHQKCRPKVAHSKPSKVSGLSSSKKDRVVGFLKDPVISVWRPVNTVESWATYDFEMHARKSPYCENRHEVHRFHDPVCDVGHRLAPAPEGFNQVQTWLSECSHFHEACQRTMNNDRALPTRLIDIQPEGGNGQFVRVVDSTQIDTSSGQVDYVAVSHTWHESDLTLSSDRLQMMKKELLRETLPRSIVEAMQAAQRIGYRYLWVDSLCILQDCEADKREECMKMASVFRNAIMTIVPHALDESSAPASHLPTGEAGNMGASTKPFADARLETCVRPATGSTTTLPPILPTIDFTSLGFAWDTRAWTFQERLLSRRYLHISNEQVYWECNSLKASETFPNGLESSLLWEKAHTKVSSTTPQPQAQQVNSAMSSQMSLATDELKKIHPSVRPFMSYTYDRAVDSEPSSSMIAHTQPFTRPTAHRLRDCQWIKKEGDGIGDSMQAAQMMLKLSSLSQKRSSSSPSANLLLSSSTMPLALSTPSTEPSSEPPRKRAKLDSANIPRRTSVATFNTISSRTKLRELWTQFTAVVEQRSRRTSTSSLTNIEPTRDNHNPSTSTGKDLGTSSLAAAVPSPARLSLSPHTDAVRGISSFNHNHPFEFRHAHRNGMDRNDMERDDLEVKVTAMMRDDAAPTVPVAAHFGFAQTEPSPLSRSNPKNKPTPSRKPTSTTNIANQTPLI